MPEKTDLSLRGLAAGAGIVLAGIGASLLAASWLARPAGVSPPPRGALLQTAPQQDIAAYRREKRQRLESTGPVDGAHVHIPIERAMRILAEGRRK